MALLDKIQDFYRAEQIVIPIIECSSSMGNEQMRVLNDLMSDVVNELIQINDDLHDFKWMIAPILFSTGANLIVNNHGSPIEIDQFCCLGLEGEGASDLGAALRLLKEKLAFEKNGGWMKQRGGQVPILILVSANKPTDDYEAHLVDLKDNYWFNRAYKYAVDINGMNKDVSVQFTGNPECIFDVAGFINNLSCLLNASIRDDSDRAIRGFEDDFAISCDKLGEKRLDIVLKNLDSEDDW